MKKLLSILAAVGLTATAGATVVACGSDPTKKDEVKLTIVTSDGKNKVTAGKDAEVKINDYKKIKGNYSKFELEIPEASRKLIQAGVFDVNEGIFKVNGLMKGEATVKVAATVKEEAPKTYAADPVKDLSSELKLVIEAASIGDIKIEGIVAGQKLTTVQNTIQTQINGLVTGTALDTDYKLTGDALPVKDEKNVKTGKITVAATTGSNYITSSFDITVAPKAEKKSIGDIKIEATVGVTKNSEVKNAIKIALNWIDSALIEGTDYEIKGLGKDNDFVVDGAKITVTAITGSTKIKDSFKVIIKPDKRKSISEIKNVEATVGVTKYSKVKTDIKEALAGIDTTLTEGTDYKIDGLGKDNDFVVDAEIIVTAITGSTKIKDSFKVIIKPDKRKSISEIKNVEATVGVTKYSKVKTDIKEALDGIDTTLTEGTDYKIDGLGKDNDFVVDVEIIVTAITGSTKIKDSFKVIIKPDKRKSISEIKNVEATVGVTKYSKVKTDIKEALDGIDTTLTEGTDYKIDGLGKDNDFVVDAEIIVTAITGSTKIKDSFKVIIKPDKRKSISEIKNVEATVGVTKYSKVKTDIKEALDGIDTTLTEGTDYKIDGLGKDNDFVVDAEIIVTAITGSTKIKDSFKVEINLALKDLSEVELDAINYNVSINITVSKGEAEALKTQVIEGIYSQLHEQFKKVTKADYTLLNLAEIKEGNLVKGVDVTIKAEKESKIFKEGTSNIVKATVTSTEKNLAKVPLNDYSDAITDKTELTDENEVNKIRKDVKTYIESQINVIYAKNVEIDTDYIIDISAIIKGKLPDFVLVSVKPSENTTFFEKEEGKWTTIKVYYKEPKSK